MNKPADPAAPQSAVDELAGRLAELEQAAGEAVAELQLRVLTLEKALGEDQLHANALKINGAGEVE
ncbi:MAG TPA: hypothetical protein VHS55_05225 [Solirubrobacteraceae bacterium]|jgi:hypothetical protein|nr:hypothetical protein [Solirubrobacteraceae bacterium]